MAWNSVQFTLHGQLSSTYSESEGAFIEIVVDALALPPLWKPEETGEREPGIDGVLFQNVVRRLVLEANIRRFRIDQGEWDHHHYEYLIEVLCCNHLWITDVQDTAKVQTAMAADGTNIDRWTTETGTIFPLKVKAIWDTADIDLNNDRWLKFPVTFQGERPKIGTTLL